MLIVGAGVLGLATAHELRDRGHAVRVVDPGEANASSVAAGMIAPALESALESAVEEATAERAALLRAARDLWPDFAARRGLILHRRPTEWRGEVGPMRARLEALGFATRLGADGRLLTDEDAQVDAEIALRALGAALGPALMRGAVARLATAGDGWRAEVRPGGAEVRARAVVLATGAAPAIPGLPATAAGQVEAIRPIRGQIGRLAGAAPAAVLRGPDGYAAPTPGGVLVGATMDAGRRDVRPDAESSARLEAVAAALLGRGASDADWRVGVRGATADGLPLAGASGAPGLFLALAPRRNGWLLAPLVAQVAADAVEGRPAGAHARALAPDRFG